MSPALAAAPLDDVLALWSGLGYYARARNLHAAANSASKRMAAIFRATSTRWSPCPASAAAPPARSSRRRGAIVFPILDGNVKRVLARMHGDRGLARARRRSRSSCGRSPTAHLPEARLADYVQAQMDFGATLCTRHDPACVLCPLQHDCVALHEGRVAELPTPKPGKPLPERSALLLVPRIAHGSVLLQRRPPTGIWASLWSLPEAADHRQRAPGSTRILPATTTPPSRWPRRARLHPLPPADRSRCAGATWRCARRWRTMHDLRWVAPRRCASLGIPAPIRKLLEADMTHGPHRVLPNTNNARPKASTSCRGPAKLGKRVFAHIGKPAWAAWLAHQTMLINENRLSPLDPKHRAFLEAEMEKFLFGGGAEKPAGLRRRRTT